ncbi:psbP domain-containing protein 3, chloroplastic isoform X2 [Cryptomeria japonica]|uniref:psbP domain-containing protein 3, chloroplastic isoform X2 n=1 Tax=Cryptomeria japonica TaxID=3369 RepID=UPI0025ABFC9F|nr:psbP domain-containing protein 3, chloroplastic isoform X2 [Cryptomeria japonica]
MEVMSALSISSSPKLFSFSPRQPHQIPSNFKNLKHGKKQFISCSQTHNNVTSHQLSTNGRRQVVCQIISLFSAFTCVSPATGAAEPEVEGDYELYKDEADNFSLLVPHDWVKGKGKADELRVVTAFFPKNDEVSNVNVVITGVGADYTRMESFGTVDAFAETLVNSLDRSWKRPPGQAAKLLNAKSKNGIYYVEYSFQKPGQSKIHLFSAVGLKFGDWYNRLYTVTGQYLEEDADKYKEKIEKVSSIYRISLVVDLAHPLFTSC